MLNATPLFKKIAMMGVVVLALCLAISAVRDLVFERSQYRAQAKNSVAESYAREQTLMGPILYRPYTEIYSLTVPASKEGEKPKVQIVREEKFAVEFPTELRGQSELTPERRMRGIFPVTVYTSHHRFRGQFKPETLKSAQPNGRIELGTPLIMMGVSDVRGLLTAPTLTLKSQSLSMGPAPTSVNVPMALAQALPMELSDVKAELPFELDFNLAGTDSIGWVPLADDNHFELSSPWPHPAFSGQFLPRASRITEDGFQARWQVSRLSSQAQKLFLDRGAAVAAESAVVKVQLIDPVDVYVKSERATKYAPLFILLTFATIFMVELVKGWRIHPIQYLLMGLALVLFYLLLLSLAEHLRFHIAYMAASVACVGLLTYYLAVVLRGWHHSLGMGALLGALYGVLYGILLSEDNALMLGSGLLFSVLSVIMVVTRRLDWYATESRSVSPVQASVPAPESAA